MVKVIKCIRNNVLIPLYFILLLFKTKKVPKKSDVLSTLIRGKSEILSITLCLYISTIYFSLNNIYFEL